VIGPNRGWAVSERDGLPSNFVEVYDAAPSRQPPRIVGVPAHERARKLSLRSQAAWLVVGSQRRDARS
jgi:hypothetical protein